MAHASWPYLEETKAILYMYPKVHADLSVISRIIPRQEFHDQPAGLVIVGLGDRLMFDSDRDKLLKQLCGRPASSSSTPPNARLVAHWIERVLASVPDCIAAAVDGDNVRRIRGSTLAFRNEVLGRALQASE